MTEKYPDNTIINLLDSDLLTDATRSVLKERLQVPVKSMPDFFSEIDLRLLVTVSDRLLPQETDRKIDLAGMLDSALAEGKGNGWRYDMMPPDEISFKKGLAGIEETSQTMFANSFQTLSEADQDIVLTRVQEGTAIGSNWTDLPSALFFEELLVCLTELYYSHPYGREEIGDMSVADKQGWQSVELNQPEAHEPISVKAPLN